MASDKSTMLRAVEIGVLVPAVLGIALPPLFQLRAEAAKASPQGTKDLRIAEIFGFGMVALLGIAESIDARSPLPFIVTVGIAGSWLLLIEWMIRQGSTK